MGKNYLELMFNLNYYKNSESGATMVEFALSGALFLILISLALEGGIALWKYSLLTDGLNLITTDRAIHLDQRLGLGQNAPGCNECGDIQACAMSISELYFDRDDVQNLTLTVSQGPFPERLLTIDAEWNHPCFFCVLVGMDEFEIRVSSTVPVEQNQSMAWQRCPTLYPRF